MKKLFCLVAITARGNASARPRSGRVLLAVLCFQLFIFTFTASSAQVGPGDLDPTFDGDGKLTTDFGSQDAYGNAVAIQPDGRIVVAGWIEVGFGSDYVLARYNPNGSLDPTFDTDGKVTTDFGFAGDSGDSNDGGEAVALQPDGRIVMAGASSGDFAVARYNPNGSLDPTFDTDGKVTTDFGFGGDSGKAVALQPDGRIVVAGWSYAVAGGNSGGDFAVARYNPNGSLDPTFDTDGKVTTDFGSQDNEGKAVALQPDGRIVVAGWSKVGSPGNDFVLARYNANGSLDGTFDTDGKVTTDFGSQQSDGTNAVAIQPDGRIVVAGYSYNAGSGDDFAVARYNANGSLDRTFDTDGKITSDVGSVDSGQAVALQPDGRIVVAGYSGSSFALARYNANGSLSPTFDTDGKVTTDIGSSVDSGEAVALQPDGRIVVAGYAAGDTGGPNNRDFAVVRYQGDSVATRPPISPVPQTQQSSKSPSAPSPGAKSLKNPELASSSSTQSLKRSGRSSSTQKTSAGPAETTEKPAKTAGDSGSNQFPLTVAIALVLIVGTGVALVRRLIG